MFATYSNYEMSIAQARGDVLTVSVTDIAMAALPFLTTVVAALVLEPTVATLVGAWAVGSLITAAAQLVLARAAPLMRSWRLARSIMRRSVSVAFANGTALLCSRIDVFVVAAVLSVSAAGVYSIPVALAANLMLLSRALLTASYRSIMTAGADAIAGRLGTSIRHSVIVVLVGGVVSLPVVAVAAGPVFGAAYADIWEPYALLVPASACLCVVEVLRHFLLTRLERQREFVLLATADAGRQRRARRRRRGRVRDRRRRGVHDDHVRDRRRRARRPVLAHRRRLDARAGGAPSLGPRGVRACGPVPVRRVPPGAADRRVAARRR